MHAIWHWDADFPADPWIKLKCLDYSFHQTLLAIYFLFFHSEWFLFIDFTKVTIKYELVILNWQDVNIWACWPLCGLVTGWWPVRGAPCLSPCDSCDRLRPVSDPESDAQKKMDGCMQNVVFECQPFPLDTNIFFTHCRCFCATGVVLFSASVCSFEPVSGT